MTERHPLTDKDIQSICDKVGNDIVDAKDEDLDGFVEDALIRAGADWQLEQVIEWLEYYPIKDTLDTGGYSALIKDFKEAMRPQEDNQ